METPVRWNSVHAYLCRTDSFNNIPEQNASLFFPSADRRESVKFFFPGYKTCQGDKSAAKPPWTTPSCLGWHCKGKAWKWRVGGFVQNHFLIYLNMLSMLVYLMQRGVHQLHWLRCLQEL